MRKRPQTRHHGCCGCILVGVLAILCLVLMTLLTTCLFRNNHDYEGSWDSSYSSGSYYDSASFWQQDDRVFYESEDGAVGKTGVDVSAYQADIDWWAVAADGIDYAMIRIAWRGNTDGYLHEDICFEQNWAGTQEVGIPCGVYFFSQAVTVEEAREEAVFALDLLAGRELTYPVVFDYEANDGHRLAGIDRETATACARTFCDIISEGGYEPMIYGNRYDLQYLDISQLSDIPIWFAEYSQAPSFEEPFAMWQYTNSGSVAGIGTPADLNLSFSTAPSTEGESL